MGDEGLKLHSTTPYQFQGHLKVPAIPAAATDLDFSLNKKVDRKVCVQWIFEEADEDADPAFL